MSALVFPTFAGLKIEQTREAIPNTLLPTSITRVETPFSYETYPRYRYRLDIEVLRSDSSLSARIQEWQKLVGFHSRVRGSLDTFLFTDDEDNSVTDHGFAVGDGSTAAFQIQRTQKGAFTDAAGFAYNQQTKPYVNLLRNASFEIDGNADGLADNWSQYNNSSSTEPALWRIVPGANGGLAQRVSWGTNNTTTKGVSATVQTVGPWTGFVVGQWYTVLFLARATGTVAGQIPFVNFDVFPANQVIVAQPTLTAAWQRCAFQFKWNPGQALTQLIYLSVNFAASCLGDLDFDEVIVTPGQLGVNDVQAFAGAAAGTRTPSYWPVLGDGFEPIFDLNGSPTIYQDGDWMGRRQLYPYTRENILPFSEQFDNAAWTKTNATITANATVAPDGTSTADQFNEGAVATAFHDAVQNTSPAEVQGELRCYSIFVKANTLPNISWRVNNSNFGINFNLSTGVIDSTNGTLEASGVLTSPLWPGWYRIWFTKRVTSTLGTGAILFGALDGTYALSYTGTSRTFFAWGAMCERVSDLSGPKPYIKTPSSAAVTVTDYAVSTTGLVTPSTVLPAGAYLSADASYYRRVRFESDSLPSTRIVQSMWSASCSLLSVK